MIQRIPERFSYVKPFAARHGVFVQKLDSAEYANRLPSAEVEALSSLTERLWRDDALLYLRRLIGACPAQWSFIGYAHAVFALGNVLKNLMAIRGSPFGLGFPYPWDKLGTEAEELISRGLPGWCVLWLEGVAKTKTPGDTLQASQDFLEMGGSNPSLGSWILECEERFGSLAIRSALSSARESMTHESSRQLASVRSLPSQPPKVEDRFATSIGIGAGASYSPWELGDATQNPARLLDLAQNARDWNARRDAGIMLQYFPMESPEEARPFVVQAIQLIVAGCDIEIACALWGRILQLVELWFPSRLSEEISETAWDAYKSSSSLIARHAAGLKSMLEEVE